MKIFILFFLLANHLTAMQSPRNSKPPSAFSLAAQSPPPHKTTVRDPKSATFEYELGSSSSPRDHETVSFIEQLKLTCCNWNRKDKKYFIVACCCLFAIAVAIGLIIHSVNKSSNVVYVVGNNNTNTTISTIVPTITPSKIDFNLSSLVTLNATYLYTAVSFIIRKVAENALQTGQNIILENILPRNFILEILKTAGKFTQFTSESCLNFTSMLASQFACMLFYVMKDCYNTTIIGPNTFVAAGVTLELTRCLNCSVSWMNVSSSLDGAITLECLSGQDLTNPAVLAWQAGAILQKLFL